jgi:hypothetical protein
MMNALNIDFLFNNQKMKQNCNNIDIDKLICDREAFNKFVYTPVNEAIRELKKRRGNKKLENKILRSLKNNLPSPLKISPRAVLFRQLATPNYETRRFMDITELAGIKPLFWEYYNDKFVSKNEVKYYLGMINFCRGIGKKGGLKSEYKKIIDFNCYNGKKISDVKTISGKKLVSFHHSLFAGTYRKLPKDYFFDASDWLKENGGTAANYYKNYLTLFVSNAIEFENFMLDIKEVSFTKELFLPAFCQVIKEFGVKPLIVALEPTEIETNEFWMCHPYSSKKFVDRKLNSIFNRTWEKIATLLKIEKWKSFIKQST